MKASNWITDGHEAYYKPGSVFMGSFIIPTANTLSDSGTNTTLTLQLVNYADPDDHTSTVTVLASWNLKLADAQSSASVWDADAKTFPATSTETVRNYSLVRNHLYTVGHKAKNTYVPGTDPDPDQPEDLSKDQTLTIKINDNWEVIHKLVVE